MCAPSKAEQNKHVCVAWVISHRVSCGESINQTQGTRDQTRISAAHSCERLWWGQADKKTSLNTQRRNSQDASCQHLCGLKQQHFWNLGNMFLQLFFPVKKLNDCMGTPPSWHLDILPNSLQDSEQSWIKSSLKQYIVWWKQSLTHNLKPTRLVHLFPKSKWQ